TMVTVWRHPARLVQESTASHVRVALNVWPQNPLRFVVVLVIRMVTFVPSQRSVAVGLVKVQAVPHSTVKSGKQVIEGGVVSTTVAVWLHVLLLPQASLAFQVRVATKVFPQVKLVVVVMILIVTFVP